MRSNSAPSIVTLKPRKARPLWFGHPWVMSHIIARVSGKPGDGDVVLICDDRGTPIDHALWSSASGIPGRTLGIGPTLPEGWTSAAPPTSFWGQRIRRALEHRVAIGLPASDDTDAYRLLNGEGDGTPGVFADVFAETVVVQLTTGGAWAHREAIVDAIVAEVAPVGVTLQSDAVYAEREGIPLFNETVRGDVPEVLRFVEAGVRYTVPTGQLQKTGHFCDLRESRRLFGRLAAGRRVLDAYCYTGAFALHAARGAAESVVAVDSSEPAIDAARANAVLNGVADRITFERAKVERYLKEARSAGACFDLISLDPPKLAPSRKALPRAMKKVEALCAEAMHVLAPGGWLLLESCSHPIGGEELCDAVSRAAMNLKRRATIAGVTQQPADHPYPAAMREGRYLTTVLVRVSGE